MIKIDYKFLLKMYSQGYFPMAKNRKTPEVEFFSPFKRFLYITFLAGGQEPLTKELECL